MRIVMLIPNPPHAVCGISDHSRNLGDALRALDCEIRYLSMRTRDGSPSVHAANIADTWDGKRGTLVGAVRDADCDVLWVQYSGYGFSEKGMPFGLARALERVRAMAKAPLIVVCMHETHASLGGHGWRGRLVERLQRAANRRVARSADVVFTSVEANLRRCVDEYGVPEDALSLLPVASNIPDARVDERDRAELRERLGLAENARIAAVFGLWSTQFRTLKLFADDVSNALRSGLIDHVIAVGGESEFPPSDPSEVCDGRLNGSLTVHGPASAEAVSRMLACCDIGLVATPPSHLGKSGVAAAFAAAALEIWLKNGQSELVVQTSPEQRPSWQALARLARRKISARMERHGHRRG